MSQLFAVLLSLFICNTFAQDVIVMKDGSTILSKVLEVNPLDIKYKKYSNQNGPIYSINKSEVMSINYENGEKDSFDTQETTEDVSNPTSQKFLELPADSRNAELISLYNRRYEPTKKIGKSNKIAKRILVIIGMKTSSLVSNGEVEIQMLTKKKKGPYYDYWCQELNIVNKTNQTIYIDKGNCFRVSSDADLHCYYDTSELSTVTSGRTSGASIGLGRGIGGLGIGGISLGSSSTSAISTTYSQQRVVGIPAKSSRLLTKDKWAAVDRTILSGEFERMESVERFQFKHVETSDIGIKEGDIHIGEVLTFGENDLPWNRRYLITYSTDENFSTYSSLTAEFYIQEIIGAPTLMSPMNYRPSLDGLMEDELKFDKFVKDYNEYTIIGYHQF